MNSLSLEQIITLVTQHPLFVFPNALDRNKFCPVTARKYGDDIIKGRCITLRELIFGSPKWVYIFYYVVKPAYRGGGDTTLHPDFQCDKFERKGDVFELRPE